MPNVYRVLDDCEQMRLGVENKIYCNSDYDGIAYVINNGSPIFGDNLDEIISHIQYGNTTTSKWISCSTNLKLDLEKYTVSKLHFQKDYRPNVAIIRDHCESSLILKGNKLDFFECIKYLSNDDLKNEQFKQAMNFIRNKKNNEIEKMVLNSSDNRLLYNLFELGFIRTKDGYKPSLDSRAFNYARASEEVLVFSKIEKYPNYSDNYDLSKDNIPYILSPLTYDILYALIVNGSIPNNPSDEIIANIIYGIKNIEKGILTNDEIGFYRNYYGCNYTLEKIINLYNDPRLDTLSLYIELKKIKRSILSKRIRIINQILGTNYDYENIHLIDDNSLVLRSKGNYQKINAELIDGTCIEVPPIDDTNSIYEAENVTNIISSIISCNDNEEFYTIYNGRLCRIPSYNLDKVKKYIRKIG